MCMRHIDAYEDAENKRDLRGAGSLCIRLIHVPALRFSSIESSLQRKLRGAEGASLRKYAKRGEEPAFSGLGPLKRCRAGGY